MTYIVYKTTNQINNRYYIGVHKTKNPDVFDGYFGSGRLIQYAIRKYGTKNFIRETLLEFGDPVSAFAAERSIVNLKDPRIYNLAPGGLGNTDIGSKYGSIGGKTCFNLKRGYHKFSFSQKSEFGKVGGKVSNERHRLNKTGFYNSDFQRILGKRGGAKCRDLRLGFFALSDERKFEIASKCGKDTYDRKVGIHDPTKRKEYASLGGKESKGCIWYNDGVRNYKYTAKRLNAMPFSDFIKNNKQFKIGKIFVTDKANRKSNLGSKSYNDGVRTYKFKPIEGEPNAFNEFISKTGYNIGKLRKT